MFFDRIKRFTTFKPGYFGAGFWGPPIPDNYFFNIQYGFIKRSKKKSEHWLLLRDEREVYRTIPLILISPVLACAHLGHSLINLKSFLRPYRRMRSLKRDLLIPARTARDLAVFTIGLVAVGILPLAFSIGIALRAMMRSWDTLGNHPLFWLLLPLTLILGAMAGVLASAVVLPFVSLAAGIFFLKNAIALVLSPLVYVVGIPLRGMITGLSKLYHRFFPQTPFESRKKIKKKVTFLEETLARAEPCGHGHYAIHLGSYDVIRCTLAELHAQFRVAMKKNAMSYISPTDEREQFVKVKTSLQRCYLVISQQTMDKIKDYLALFHAEQHRAQVRRAGAFYRVYLKLAEQGIGDPVRDCVAPNVLGCEGRPREEIDKIVSAEFERQRLMTIISDADYSAETRNKHGEKIETVTDKEKIVPVKIAEIYNVLLFTANPRDAVAKVKKMQADANLVLKF